MLQIGVSPEERGGNGGYPIWHRIVGSRLGIGISYQFGQHTALEHLGICLIPHIVAIHLYRLQLCATQQCPVTNNGDRSRNGNVDECLTVLKSTILDGCDLIVPALILYLSRNEKRISGWSISIHSHRHLTCIQHCIDKWTLGEGGVHIICT